VCRTVHSAICSHESECHEYCTPVEMGKVGSLKNKYYLYLCESRQVHSFPLSRYEVNWLEYFIKGDFCEGKRLPLSDLPVSAGANGRVGGRRLGGPSEDQENRMMDEMEVTTEMVEDDVTV
jgi:hypothetical protein